MEQIFSLHNLLIAGLIEVIWLNFLVGKKEIAILVGGEGIAHLSNIISALILLITVIKLSYFLVIVVMIIVVGLTNIITYPILKLVGAFIWGLFAPSHFVVSDSYERSRGEIWGCRLLALTYSVFGGGYTLYYIFAVL